MSVEARWALAGGAEGPLNPSTTPILELPEMERLYDPASHDMESDLGEEVSGYWAGSTSGGDQTMEEDPASIMKRFSNLLLAQRRNGNRGSLPPILHAAERAFEAAEAAEALARVEATTLDTSGASGSGAPSRMTIVQLDDDYEQQTPSPSTPDRESAAAAAEDAVDAPATPELHTASYGAFDVRYDDVHTATDTAAGLALHESSPGGGGDDGGGDDGNGLMGLMRPDGGLQADDLRVVADSGDSGDGEPLPSLGTVSSDATRDLASTDELMLLMSAMNL